MTVGAQLVEAIRAHEPVGRAEAAKRAVEALRAVRLSEPERGWGSIRMNCRAACASA
jgi:peptide/nickel transport system ATP-binding protein